MFRLNDNSRSALSFASTVWLRNKYGFDLVFFRMARCPALLLLVFISFLLYVNCGNHFELRICCGCRCVCLSVLLHTVVISFLYIWWWQFSWCCCTLIRCCCCCWISRLILSSGKLFMCLCRSSLVCTCMILYVWL